MVFKYRGENFHLGGGLKFVKFAQFCKIIAHWRALAELYVFGVFGTLDLKDLI